MMYGSWFKNNVFENNYVNDWLSCAGHNFVIENHTGNVYFWERTRSYLVRNIKSGNIVGSNYESLTKTGYTRIENINIDGDIHAYGQIIKNCSATSIYTGKKGAVYRSESKKMTSGSKYEDCEFILDNFSSYIGSVKLKNCIIQPSEETQGYKISLNQYNVERTFENCDFVGKVTLDNHNMFNSGDFVHCKFDDLKIHAGVADEENDDKNFEIRFIDCKILNSTREQFIRFCPHAYSSGYSRIIFRNCDITTNNTGESLIYMYSSPLSGSYVKFEDCNLKTNDKYLLSGYCKVSSNNLKQALDIYITNTDIDKDKVFYPTKEYELYPERFRIIE